MVIDGISVSYTHLDVYKRQGLCHWKFHRIFKRRTEPGWNEQGQCSAVTYGSVSYTHLDVYKRQGECHLESEDLDDKLVGFKNIYKTYHTDTIYSFGYVKDKYYKVLPSSEFS